MHPGNYFIRLVVIGLLACGPAARLEAQTDESPLSKLPSPQIVAARSIFIMNAGSENPTAKTSEKQRFFSGGPDRPYNQFYAAMKNWGRFRLMPSPAGADLMVEIQYVRGYPAVERASNAQQRDCERRLNCSKKRSVCHCSTYVTAYHSQLDLIVRDAETHTVLRTFTRLVEIANAMDKRHKNDRQEVLDRNFDDALNSVVGSFGDVARGNKAPESVYFPEVRIAPGPDQLTQARRVWIARARHDSGRAAIADMEPLNSDLAYNTFYALIKNGGVFKIADSPSDADLILQISTVTYDQTNPLYKEQRIDVTVVDPKTGTGLWTFLHDVPTALFPGNFRRGLQETVAGIVYNLTGLAGNLTPAEIPKDAAPAPSPLPAGSGQKVFIANSAGRMGGVRPRDNDRIYNDFYLSVKKLNAFQMVNTPGASDMIFALTSDSGHLNLRIVDTRTRTALLDLAPADQDSSSERSGPGDFPETIARLLDQAAHSPRETGAEGADLAPKPTQLAAAKKMFLAFPHAGWDVSTRDADELYSGIAAAMKSWGRFEIAPTPAEADIIADLSIETENGTNVKIAFLDPRTRIAVWAVNEQLAVPYLVGFRSRNIPRTVDALINHIRKMVAEHAP